MVTLKKILESTTPSICNHKAQKTCPITCRVLVKLASLYSFDPNFLARRVPCKL